jgi:Na+/H+-dicarboxylate symporter
MIVSKYTILGLQVIVIAVLLYFVLEWDLLPMKYKLMATGTTISLLLIYTSIALLFGANMLMAMNNAISNVTDKDTETHVVSIWVMKDSPKTKLQDLEDDPVAVSYQHDATNVTAAIDSFENDLGSSLTLEEKDDYA